jgi:hypothetical protein
MRFRPTTSASHPKNTCPIKFPTGAATLSAKSWFLERWCAKPDGPAGGCCPVGETTIGNISGEGRTCCVAVGVSQHDRR